MEKYMIDMMLRSINDLQRLKTTIDNMSPREIAMIITDSMQAMEEALIGNGIELNIEDTEEGFKVVLA